MTALGGVAGFGAIAKVAIIAKEGLPAQAATVGITGLAAIADVLVVTKEWFSGQAASIGVATLGAIAQVSIIAKERGTTHTFTKSTGIVGGADVTVIAESIIVGVDAALGRVAGVVGTGVTVIANPICTSRTDASFANIP